MRPIPDQYTTRRLSITRTDMLSDRRSTMVLRGLCPPTRRVSSGPHLASIQSSHVQALSDAGVMARTLLQYGIRPIHGI